MKISKRTRDKFREHSLKIEAPDAIVIGASHINQGRDSSLFRCVGHCDWLGWMPLDEVAALEQEQTK